MTTWEYKVVVQKAPVCIPEAEPADDEALIRALDQYGVQGWELVSVVSQSYRREYDPATLYGLTILQLYFKRPRASGGS
jgi:Domain of unknown function (DUF4177)